MPLKPKKYGANFEKSTHVVTLIDFISLSCISPADSIIFAQCISFYFCDQLNSKQNNSKHEAVNCYIEHTSLFNFAWKIYATNPLNLKFQIKYSLTM